MISNSIGMWPPHFLFFAFTVSSWFPDLLSAQYLNAKPRGLVEQQREEISDFKQVSSLFLEVLLQVYNKAFEKTNFRQFKYILWGDKI